MGQLKAVRSQEAALMAARYQAESGSLRNIRERNPGGQVAAIKSAAAGLVVVVRIPESGRKRKSAVIPVEPVPIHIQPCHVCEVAVKQPWCVERQPGYHPYDLWVPCQFVEKTMSVLYVIDMCFTWFLSMAQ